VQGVRRLRGVIQTERPSLIHTALFRADQIGRLAGFVTRTPVVSSLVNVSYDRVRLRDNPHLSWWKLRSMQLLDLCSARLVQRFHAVAESVKSANCRHLRLDPRRVTVVYRGRDPDGFAAPQVPSGQPRSGQQILSVGRLVDQKGHRYLIEALPAILARFPQARLRIAGDGWLRESLAALSRNLGVHHAVELLGTRADVPTLLAEANVFAFPSLFEGLPGVLVEAMLAGCPIVASDLPVARELMQDGFHGRLVAATDPRMLADAIIGLLRDPQRARVMGDKARQLARERFDIRRVVGEMERFYTEVANESKSRKVAEGQRGRGAESKTGSVDA
jgi:glycosyltransferase involved in cell wall biosynthesis